MSTSRSILFLYYFTTRPYLDLSNLCLRCAHILFSCSNLANQNVCTTASSGIWWVNLVFWSMQRRCWHWDFAFGKCLRWIVHLLHHTETLQVNLEPKLQISGAPPHVLLFTDKKRTFTECLLISVDLYAYSLYVYLFLPQLKCPFKAVVARRVRPGAPGEGRVLIL